MAWYRVRIEATHKGTGQVQECDRAIVADHQQAAVSTGMQLLGVNAREWQIDRCEAIGETVQRAIGG